MSSPTEERPARNEARIADPQALRLRLIPCLDVRDGKVVKGTRFVDLVEAGDPVDCARRYAEDGADELVVLDITATLEERLSRLALIERLRALLPIPLTVGGGLRDVEEARELLDAGADKVSLNSAAIARPGLVRELSDRFGRQCVVVAIDAARMGFGSDGPPSYEVRSHAGRRSTGLDALSWARSVETLGAGELLLTSIDRDGTGKGYELDLLRAIRSRVRLPMIASGGASELEHFVEGAEAGATGLLAASIFHLEGRSLHELKRDLAARGLRVRGLDPVRT